MSPRKPDAVQRIKDERREEILRAARGVFAQNGLAATKMADIATAAGVSYGLVYHYFPTKEAIYAALIETVFQRIAVLSEKALEQEGSPWQRLGWLCEQMLSGAHQDPDYTRLVHQAYAGGGLPPEARVALAHYVGQMQFNLIRLIIEGQKAGQVVDGDPGELARTFLAAMQGVALTDSRSSESQTYPRVETILRLLKP